VINSLFFPFFLLRYKIWLKEEMAPLSSSRRSLPPFLLLEVKVVEEVFFFHWPYHVERNIPSFSFL